jgi:hypothetical protein
MSWRRAALAFATVVAAAVGCASETSPEVPNDSGAGTGGSSTVEPDAGLDASVAGAMPDAGDADAGDAETSAPVRLGIRPTAGTDSVEDQARAELEVLASGARAVSHLARWDELTNEAGTPSSDRWAALERASSLEGGEYVVLFSLGLVDGQLDARPDSLSGPWNGAGTLSAVEQLIDRALTTFDGGLAYLTFGLEVDRYLDSAVDRSDFVELTRHAIDYTRQHALLPSTTRVGVAVSWRGLLAPSDSLRELLDAGNVLAVSYLPLDTDHQAEPPSQTAGHLDALLESVDARPPSWQDDSPPSLVLQQVSYPSAVEAGSSLEAQADFFDLFFQALQTRRGRFPLVIVDGLHDAAVPRCETAAAAWGAPGDAAAIAAACSLGLRDANGEEKPALDTVLQALARFFLP